MVNKQEYKMSVRKFIIVILSLLIITSLSVFLISCDNKEKESEQEPVNKPEENNDDIEEKKDELQAELKKNGEKYVISLVISGEFYAYSENFIGILNTLKEKGWMNDFTFSDEARDSFSILYKELTQKNDYSDYIEFPEKYFFDFNWEEESKNNEKFQHILNSNEIDLIISFGTLSGTILSEPDSFDIPVLVATSSDPVKSGIIKSNEDSGKDYLTAFADPNRFIRQVRLFHNIVKFKKLGILYTDTEVGRTYAALSDIEKVAEEKDFEIISNTDLIEEDSDPQAPKRYVEALKEIAPKVDAVYFTIQAGFTIENLPNIIDVINKYKLPTFAMEESKFVKHGVLFSISAYEGKSIGEFNARKVIKILKGAKPRDLEQIFSVTPSISINLKEADLIDFSVPIDILSSSDEVYKEIEWMKDSNK